MTPQLRFPLNAWYAIAWSHEVSASAVLGRSVCNQKIALWRKPDGNVAALEDACWHRRLPLSLGHIDGEQVVCRYHGLAFDSAGRCTRMPSQDKISSAAKVRAFPAVDTHRLIWVWPGDAALADPALVPDMHWNTDPEWEGDGETMFVKCDYRLQVDNLMDLTHETFVHASSIGQSAIAETPITTVNDERTVTATRWMLDIDAPPFWRTQLGRPGNVDRWQIIRFKAPCTIVLDVGVALAGTGDTQSDRSKGLMLQVLNTITPETDSTCMYFWSILRNYRLRDQSLTNSLRMANARIFEEDRAVVEAQQRYLEANPGQRLNNLSIDSGSMRARRIIDRMIADGSSSNVGSGA